MSGIQVLPIRYASEIARGDDLAAILLGAAPALVDGDVVVVSHKAVAKAEGALRDLATVQPSPLARTLAGPDGDPRHIQAILDESRRVLRRRGGLLICETHHGYVCASAGVDRSNAPPGHVVLLPRDPDGSARALRDELERRARVRLAVVVADTTGRPFREGIVGVAIGVAGLEPLRRHAGAVDPSGYALRTSSVAVADELAAAADLVLGKLERVPAALVRGAGSAGEGSASELVRPPERDLFR